MSTSTEIVESITAASVGQRVIRVGDRLAADDALVRANPGWFVDPALTDEQKRSLAAKALYEPVAEHLPKPTPPRRPPALKVVGYEAISGPYLVGEGKRERVLYAGDRLAVDSELPKRYPWLFRPITAGEGEAA